ncbi:D-alanine--D-alanine ligase [Marmoricola endophyticus]|uniref:D-alanine--D-alanine ligase n=1 Tax=Marmoricola endophyticus TaxID=2040280 RepID=A0A917BDU4_9ACTN|nr:D-alanine--D-alanine ligase family protein [Marmoricola endophyticus]GGF39213.1 D-alanine--D-alanine ligase [Marmoricola endophyticus]
MSETPTPRVRPRVAVVFGGRSSEHGISCVTAGSVLAAIDPEEYDVVPIGIAHDGRWVLEAGEPERLAIGAGGALPQVDAARPVVRLDQDGGALTVQPPGEVPRALGEVDVVLPLLHGPFGEDGTLQGLLELADVAYVGAGVLASAVSMDKHYMKVVLRSAGLPVLPHVLVTPRGWEQDREACRESVRALGYPVFVKPCRGGSSMGISKVRDESGLDAAIETAREHDPRVLVESFSGPGAREIECGVLETEDGRGVSTSVAAEILVGGEHEFYDFAAKYLPEEATDLHVPADLEEDTEAEIRQYAAEAFLALGIEGLARVDFFVQDGGRVVINEVNTMPGFTPTSMFPRMWAASGVEYPTLVRRLLTRALARGTGLR